MISAKRPLSTAKAPEMKPFSVKISAFLYSIILASQSGLFFIILSFYDTNFNNDIDISGMLFSVQVQLFVLYSLP
jgi:hypothetical protein